MKVIEGFHFRKNKSGNLIIKHNKKFIWEIPEKLLNTDINKGDIVLVECTSLVNNKPIKIISPILVVNVYDIQSSSTKLKKVLKVLDKI